METNENLNEFLSEKLRSYEAAPSIDLVREAREKIIARKKNEEQADIYSLIAAFLNFKIRLYHAVIATIIISGIVLYFSRQNENAPSSSQSSQYVSNLASVKNSTVLSSIQTFILKK
jgi:hypothetical protein